MPLTRKTTVLFKRETISGEAETLSAADLLPVNDGPSVTPEFGRYVRNKARATLTKPAASEGLKSGSTEFGLDLQGPASGDAGDDGPYVQPLLCSGMMRWNTRRVIIALMAGGTVIPSGSRYTSASSDGGVCIGDIVDGDPFAFVLQDQVAGAIVASDTFTFDNGVSITLTAGAIVDGKSFHPQTDPLSSIFVASVTGGTIPTGVRIEQDQGGGVVARGVTQAFETMTAAGGVLYFVHDDASAPFDDSAAITLPDFPSVSATVTASRVQDSVGNASATTGVNLDGVEIQLKGWRGNPSWRLKNGENGKLEFTGQGAGKEKPDDIASGGSVDDGAAPPPVIGGLYLLGASYAPCYSEAVWTLGNDVSLRECPAEASGYHGAQITDRNPTINIDPEIVKEAIFPTLGHLWDQTTFRVAFSIGAGTPGGNNFVLQAKAAQVESASPGDRNGNVTWDKVLALTGAADDELIMHAY